MAFLPREMDENRYWKWLSQLRLRTSEDYREDPVGLIIQRRIPF